MPSKTDKVPTVSPRGELTSFVPPVPPTVTDRNEHGTFIHGLFTTISNKYDLMNDLESLGLHRLWKRRLVQEVSAGSPLSVLDVACGTGDIAIALAAANPQAQVLGLDFCQPMLDVAYRRAAHALPLSWIIEGDKPAHPRKNLRFVQADAVCLPFESGSFEAVSIAFGLRNMPDLAAVLAEMLRVLRPGGRFACLETSYPHNPLIKPAFRLYFKRWLPYLGGLITGKAQEYAWLNTSTETFLSKRQLATLLAQVGFINVRWQSFLLGAAALHSASKPS